MWQRYVEREIAQLLIHSPRATGVEAGPGQEPRALCWFPLGDAETTSRRGCRDHVPPIFHFSRKLDPKQSVPDSKADIATMIPQRQLLNSLDL